MHLTVPSDPSVAGRDLCILSKLNKVIKEVNKYIEDYTFGLATNAIHSFFIYDVCDTYLELMKPVFYDLSEENKGKMYCAKMTLFTVLEQFLRLIHPFMPFVSEELWQRLPFLNKMTSVRSIMIASYPTEVSIWENEEVHRSHITSYSISVLQVYRLHEINSMPNLWLRFKNRSTSCSCTPVLFFLLSLSLSLSLSISLSLFFLFFFISMPILSLICYLTPNPLLLLLLPPPMHVCTYMHSILSGREGNGAHEGADSWWQISPIGLQVSKSYQGRFLLHLHFLWNERCYQQLESRLLHSSKSQPIDWTRFKFNC